VEVLIVNTRNDKVLVVGAGIFGTTAALELGRRGYEVHVVDPGPLPRPEASSVDTSRSIRMDYGSDLLMTEMAEACLTRWRELNARFGEDLYHEDGFLFLTRGDMQASEFERDSYQLLSDRGWELERLDDATIRSRFPMFCGAYTDGYLNPHDGWASSGRVLELLIRQAHRMGVRFIENAPCTALRERGGKVVGVDLEGGDYLEADMVVVAAGVWTKKLLPWLADFMSCVGQAVFYFEVEDGERWRFPSLPTWSADISNTGWYGFPALADGVVKIANHGPGRVIDPDDDRQVLSVEEDVCRAFLAESLPELRDAPIQRRRICPYNDTWDGSFLIDHDPDRQGLVVATGGSGHGFKFAPLLGEVIADVVERKDNRYSSRFEWRKPSAKGVELARRQ
jgi:sarcosine oxidase / L-pipecolate oxidase